MLRWLGRRGGERKGKVYGRRSEGGEKGEKGEGGEGRGEGEGEGWGEGNIENIM